MVIEILARVLTDYLVSSSVADLNVGCPQESTVDAKSLTTSMQYHFFVCICFLFVCYLAIIRRTIENNGE